MTNQISTTVYGTRYFTNKDGEHIFKAGRDGNHVQCGRGGERFSSSKQMWNWIRRNLIIEADE